MPKRYKCFIKNKRIKRGEHNILDINVFINYIY